MVLFFLLFETQLFVYI